MYNDEYLARHKHHSCYDEHYNPYGINMYRKMDYNIPYAYCPYMSICPLMQQQNLTYQYPMVREDQFSASTGNDLNYKEEHSENLFRHPYGHMSYYYYDLDANSD